MSYNLPPTAPTITAVSPVAGGSLRVDWTMNAANEHVNYYLVYRGGIENFVVGESSLIAQSDTNSIDDTEVTGSMTYYYRVIAVYNSGVQSGFSNVRAGKAPLDSIVWHVTIWCLVGIGILLLVVFTYDSKSFDKQAFTLTVDGNPTFTDDKVSGIVNKDKESITLAIYGINNSATPHVYSTNLTDNTGNTIIPLAVKFSDQNNTISEQDEKGRQIAMELNKSNIKPGVFEGLILVRDDVTSPVSIQLATEPMLIQAVIIAGIGILTSIILWEFIKYFRKNNNVDKKQQLDDKGQRDFHRVSRYLDEYDSVKKKRDDSQSQLELLKIQRDLVPKNKKLGLAEQEEALRNLQPEIDRTRESILKYDRDAENIRLLESKYRASYEVSRRAAEIKTEEVEGYKSRSREKGSLAAKIAISEFGSALFGISIGVFGLLTNDYVLGLRNIQGLEILVLFGLGLGIGSLKEFVDKE